MAEILKPDMQQLWASGGAIISPSLAKIQVGWTAEIPPHQWENWAQNRQDRAIGYLFQHGIPEWDVFTEYFSNRSIVQVNGVLYRATQDSVGEDPTVSTTSWQPLIVLPDVDEMLVGMVAYFATNTPPTGWLKANAAAVSRTTYSRLFNRIGTTYGAGDGSTTFNLPEGRGEFIRGWDDGRGVDAGRIFGSSQGHSFASHTHGGTTNTTGFHGHGVNDPGHSHELQTVGNDWSPDGGDRETPSGQGRPPERTQTSGTGISLQGAGDHAHTLNISSTGGTETRPRNIAFLACIKY